jgi:TPP-dependent pyruvate/acetoin dehydrogenase alpha subunit
VGGTQHLHTDNLYTNGVQGGIVPNAVGAALAEKLQGTGAIVAVFLGDGTLGQGTVYESLNIAALWSLPVLFVLEDNQYAQSTHRRFEHAGDLARRAAPFQIEAADIPADDVFAVHEAARAAVARVRGAGRPFFLTLRTYRLAPHSKGDDTRAEAELAHYRALDPLARLARQLPDDVRAAVDAQVEARVTAAVAAALAAPAQTLAEFQENARWRQA